MHENISQLLEFVIWPKAKFAFSFWLFVVAINDY